MEAFTHLSILISIILALGIAELLTGFARIIERRHLAPVYAPNVCWALFLLLVHIQTWWTIFGLRSHPSWTFVEFSVVLLQPIALYLLSALTLSSSSTEPDLRKRYFSHRIWFFALFAFLLLVSIVKDLILFGALPGAANLAFHGVFFAVAVVGLLTKKDGVHRLLGYVSLLIIGIYIALLFSRLA